MNGAKTITHILFPIFIGMIIGCAVSGNSTLLVWGIVLLILDIIIGVALQHAIDKESYNDDWHSLSFEQKREMAHYLVEKAKQDMRDEGIDVDGEIEKFCDEFNREHRLGKYSDDYYDDDEDEGAEENDLCDELDAIYSRLKANGGARLTNNIRGDEAGIFLLNVCDTIPHAPLPHTLVGLYAISIENLDGELAIVYSFRYATNSICQNVFIFLVHTKAEKIRLFAVETDFSAFVLCEYSGNSHLNYGRVELKKVPTRIKAILNM